MSARRNPIAQAHSLRGPAGSGPHGGRLPRERVEVCQDCAAVLFRGACPDCTTNALRELRTGAPSTTEP